MLLKIFNLLLLQCTSLFLHCSSSEDLTNIFVIKGRFNKGDFITNVNNKRLSSFGKKNEADIRRTRKREENHSKKKLLIKHNLVFDYFLANKLRRTFTKQGILFFFTVFHIYTYNLGLLGFNQIRQKGYNHKKKTGINFMNQDGCKKLLINKINFR